MLNLLKQEGIKAVFRLTTARLKPSVRRQTGATYGLRSREHVGRHFGQNDRRAVNCLTRKKSSLPARSLKPIKSCCPYQLYQYAGVKAFRKNLPVVRSTLDHRSAIGAFALVKRAMLNGTLLQRLLES